MRRLFSLLTLSLPLALLALLAAAQPVAGQDTQAVASGYTVRGTVVNAITGQSVAHALVELDRETAMLTDSNGAFSFDNVQAGEYSMSVNKPGFLGHGGFNHAMVFRAGRGSIPPRPQPYVRIQVGPDMPAVTLRITPLATITGHVTLSTADPADGIGIQVFARQFQNGHPHWALAGTARTRSDGSFRMAGLQPGSYRVSTMASLDRPAQAFSSNHRLPIWGYPSLYYPGVTDINAAGTLTLGAGQQAEADLTLVRQQFFPVAALVHSSSDTPANFEILDTGGRSTGLSANWDRREGVVHAAVPNGTWTLEAHAYGRNAEWGSATFQVSGAPVALAISILPVPHIPIVIRREFLASTDSSQVVNSGPGMNLTLISADGNGQRAGGMMHTDGSNGSEWELNVNEPGSYWVQAQAFPPAYISSITSGGIDLGSNPLIVVPGSTPLPVEVTLHNDGGSITGQIAGQAAGSGPTSAPGERPQLWIYAIPLFSTPQNLPEGSLQANGQFTIPNIAPGSYRVVACDTQQDIDFHSPEGLAAWAGKGQTITVDPGGTASVDLDVVHTTAEEEPQ